MKKFLFYPLCLMMWSCDLFNNSSNSFSNKESISIISSELDKVFDQEETNKDKLLLISPVLLAIRKVYDAGNSNVEIVRDRSCDNEWQNHIIEFLEGSEKFDQVFIRNLIEKMPENSSATKMFLDFYKELYGHSKEKNIYTTKEDDHIAMKNDDSGIIDITKQDLDNFKKKLKEKEGEKKKNDNNKNEKSHIYLSDLVNYHLKSRGLSLLKNKKYLVVRLYEKGEIEIENKDNVDVFKRNFSGGTILKHVCTILSNGQYFEDYNILTQNIPKFLRDIEDSKKIDNKKEEVISLYKLVKVSNENLESLIKDE